MENTLFKQLVCNFEIRNPHFEIFFSMLHALCPMLSQIRNPQFKPLSSVVCFLSFCAFFPRLARLARPPVSS
jgi:hypothetical protein